MSHPLDFLYETQSIKPLFGKHWCGPDKFKHGEKIAVGFYPSTADGPSVTVFCTAWPALFCEIVIDGCDSKITTGTGMVAFAAAVASDIAYGMVSIRKNEA